MPKAVPKASCLETQSYRLCETIMLYPPLYTQPDCTTSCFPTIMTHNIWYIIFFILNSFGCFLFFLSTNLLRLAEASLLSGIGDTESAHAGCCLYYLTLIILWGSWQLPLCRLLHRGTGDLTVWTTSESYSLFVHSDSLWSVYSVYTAIHML